MCMYMCVYMIRVCVCVCVKALQAIASGILWMQGIEVLRLPDTNIPTYIHTHTHTESKEKDARKSSQLCMATRSCK